jgi:UDPglucose 6-dehydrogenase/GDP-mannose 6-dehydrogenase
MRVCVVGAGYVGVVTAACLAELGHRVTCADVDRDRVDLLVSGKPTVHEAGLSELLARNVGERLTATTDVGAAVSGADVTLVAVGTPSKEDGIDLGAVVAATREIGTALGTTDGYHAVVVKSTVVPGTTDGVVLPLLVEESGRTAGRDFGVGMNPEFLTEGQAVSDFMEPDRLVLGGIDEHTHAALEELYAPFPSSVPRMRTNTRTAEMVKYASNALLATSISFANEIGNLCAAVGDVDVVDVMRGVHLSRYLTVSGPDGTPDRAPLASYLDAGCGFGGSCLPKDVRALIAEGERLGRPMRVLSAVLETNDAQPEELLALVERAIDLDGRRVAVLGMAFKPDTDDVRESPTIPLVRGLVSRGARVTVHDPVVRAVPDELRALGVGLSDDLDAVLNEADAVVLATRWEQYREVPRLLAARAPAPLLVDGRRMLDRDSVPNYVGIGLG